MLMVAGALMLGRSGAWLFMSFPFYKEIHILRNMNSKTVKTKIAAKDFHLLRLAFCCARLYLLLRADARS